MKKLLLFIFIITSSISFGQINLSRLLNENTEATLTRYDQSNVIKSSTNFKFNNIVRSGGNISVNSLTNFNDNTGNTQLTRDLTYKLNTNSVGGQSFFIDMRYFIPISTAVQFKNYTINTIGSAYEIPVNLSANQSLNPISMSFTFTPSNGFSSSSTTIKYLNRIVEKREKITTPSGTYNCWKITEVMEIKTSTLTKQNVTRWINEQIGIVKVEYRDYSTNNLLETEQLTRFQLPTIINNK